MPLLTEISRDTFAVGSLSLGSVIESSTLTLSDDLDRVDVAELSTSSETILLQSRHKCCRSVSRFEMTRSLTYHGL